LYPRGAQNPHDAINFSSRSMIKVKHQRNIITFGGIIIHIKYKYKYSFMITAFQFLCREMLL